MNTIVSVNVGLPREVQWQGKTVRTAIWKTPVEGRVFAARLNLRGDGQADLAGHGGEQRAVMVYQLASYRYWARQLGRSDFVYGMFGENFTVDGLADDEVCIGDRFRIGSAVFEISQPRVTCYRVGIRLNAPEMPALLVSHRRPGFYFRVIQQGEVGAGDRIEKIASGPEQMTVAEIDTLLYSAQHPIDGLQRAVQIPALSRGWHNSMRTLLEAAQSGASLGKAGRSAAPAAAASWPGFRTLKVLATRAESIDVRSFELAAADGSALPAARAGQHVVVRVHPSPNAAPLARSYSLCDAAAGTYTIAVKKEAGPGSAFLHDHVCSGDLLEVSAPRGSFTLAAGSGPVVLLSAGIGLTPLLAMLHAAAASDDDASREVWWFHATRDAAHHAFAQQIRSLMKRLEHGHLYTLYSRPGAEDLAGIDYDEKGHLSAALLRDRGVPQAADFYLCGPAGFLADLQSGLKAWQVDAARIHTEVFGPQEALAPGVVGAAKLAPHLPSGAEGTGPRVSFLRSGIAPRWDARFHSLLELAEACSVPVRWSCRSGVCHNCESGVIEGRLEYFQEPLDPPPEGIALICCARPLSDVALDL